MAVEAGIRPYERTWRLLSEIYTNVLSLLGRFCQLDFVGQLGTVYPPFPTQTVHTIALPHRFPNQVISWFSQPHGEPTSPHLVFFIWYCITGGIINFDSTYQCLTNLSFFLQDSAMAPQRKQHPKSRSTSCEWRQVCIKDPVWRRSTFSSLSFLWTWPISTFEWKNDGSAPGAATTAALPSIWCHQVLIPVAGYIFGIGISFISVVFMFI